MRRRSLMVLAAAIASPAARAAAQRKRLPRVALVFNTIPLTEMTGVDPSHPWAQAFMQGLREQRLIDGRDLLVERHSAEGRLERLPMLMQNLVGSGVEVIVTLGPAVNAARRASDRVAIVAVTDDPEAGLVESLRRPGGNLTGIGGHSLQGLGKELQLLKEAVPSIAHVAVIDGQPPSALPIDRRRAELQRAADRLQLRVLWLRADAPEQLDAAFETIVRERADALFAVGNAVNYPQRRRLAEFALRQRLPSVGWPEEGALMAYSLDDREAFRRAAAFVKRILDGAKPGDLPFEQTTKYSLVINLRTAKALGLTIPQSLLLRADEVIE